MEKMTASQYHHMGYLQCAREARGVAL